jgi:hypothetical protein
MKKKKKKKKCPTTATRHQKSRTQAHPPTAAANRALPILFHMLIHSLT